MLGRFLEFSVGAPDIRASFDFYRSLGFLPAEVGEARRYRYAVLTDGRICIGLHDLADAPTCLTFVKPELIKHLADLERVSGGFTFSRLSSGEFNEIGWSDPSGNLIRLVEARTFSPHKPPVDRPTCGYFLEIALPAIDREQSKQHWERCGFVGIEEADAPLPSVGCTSDSIDIGLHEPAHIAAPTLRFEVEDLPALRRRLAALAVPANGRVPAPLHGSAVAITAPEGTLLLVSGPPEPQTH